MHEFFEKAAAHLRFAGKKSGDFPVIRREENKREWSEWIDYFGYVGLKKSAELMSTGIASWTVPALSPRDFDPVVAAIAVEQGVGRRGRMRDLSPAARAAIVAQWRSK